MKLARNLRSAIASQGLSVAELADRAGVPRKTLYHWLNGQSPRNLDQFVDVCQILGVTIESLLDRNVDASKTSQGKYSSQSLEDGIRAGLYEVILIPVKRK